jgi:hypothetical protein
MVRREDELINNANTDEHVAGFGLTRNPGVTLLWYTRTFDLIPDGLNKPESMDKLFMMGTPEKVEYYCKGRKATLQEIQESVDTGLPALKQLATDQGPEATSDLYKAIAKFQKYLPKE